jgi:O-antigen/teichoic acid export membrane protein
MESYPLGDLLLWILLVNLLALQSNIFFSVLNGFQRMDLTSGIQMIGLLIGVLTQVVMLLRGLGLTALALGLTTTVAANFLFSLYHALKLIPDFFFDVEHFSASLLRLIKLSLGEIAVRISGIVASSIDKFLIGLFVGVSHVAYYDLTFQLLAQLRALPSSAYSMIVPLASEFQTLTRQEQSRIMFSKAMKYLHLMGVPLFGFVLAFAHPIISVWLGKELDLVASGLQVILLSNYINLMTGPSYAFSVGFGQFRTGLRFSVLLLLLSCTMSPFLTLTFKYFGALWGYALSASVSSLYIIILVGRENKFQPLKEYVTSFVRPAFATAFLVLSVFLLYQLTNAFYLGVNWLSLAVAAVISIFSIFFIFKKLDLVGAEEADMFRNLLFAYAPDSQKC